MARSRNIKPGFFRNEVLGTADPLYSLLFEGLWVLADREGRLEDRPLRIKADIFPYREGLDIEAMLSWLERNVFIQRYDMDGKHWIQITNFIKHQNPHKNETPSEIPPPPADYRTPTDEIGATSEKIGTARACSLIPDSLIPSTLIPDSPFPSGTATPEPSPCEADPVLISPAKALRGPDPTARETWEAYASSYELRYKAAPVRNAKVNTQVANLVKRLGSEAPEVARFYLTHNGGFYVARMHDFGLLLSDAEKLRTEWATGSRMTATRARQVDSTQSNMDAAQQAKELLRQRGANV